MKKAQLELALRFAGKIARDRDFIVFGSQCILGIVKSPPKECLVSQELDLYPRNLPEAMPLLVARLGRRSAFARANGFFVDCVTPELAAMPDGWTERLIPFRTKATGGITGWCLEPHDLAASKLAAGRAKDLEYVGTLIEHGLIKRATLNHRIISLPLVPSHIEQRAALVKTGFRRRPSAKRRSKSRNG